MKEVLKTGMKMEYQYIKK